MNRLFRNLGLTWAAVLVCVNAVPALGKNYTVRISNQTDAQGKLASGSEASCWLPDGIKHVRGVIVAHPMASGVAGLGKVAQEEDLGTMVYDGLGDIVKLDQVLEQWAKVSGHPELRGAAVLTAGLSASCIASRVAGYEIPDRVFGIVNIAGANLHSPRKDTLLGVPFQLHVGQYEEFGPDGGIRPHLLNESQWYCLAEDIRNRRTKNPDALLSMVAVPNGKHGSWNTELAAMFVKKAAQLRLPKDDKRDGSTPAKCLSVKYEDGWLSDGEVKYTTYDPAPYGEYKGDKGKTLWHLDRELAMAVHDYHRKAYGEPGALEKVWPLGDRLPVTLAKDRDPKNDFATMLPWFSERFQRKQDDPVVRIICAAVTRQINQMDIPRQRMLRDLGLEAVVRQSVVNVFDWYGYSVEPFEKAVTSSKLPPEFKAALLRRQMMLSVWPMRRSDRTGVLMAMDRSELGVPDAIVENSSVVKLPPDRTLRQELTARWPGFAKASPVSQYLLYAALAEFNPCLDLEGSFVGSADEARSVTAKADLVTTQLMESLYAFDPEMRPKPDAGLHVEKVSIQVGTGLEHTFRFNVRPERVLLVPDAGTLSAMANPKKAVLRNVGIIDASMLSGLDPEELDLAGCRIADLRPLGGLKNLRVLRLSENPVRDLAPLKGLPLRSLDLAGTEVTDLAPLSGMAIESLVVNGTAVAGLAPLRGMRLKHLDLRDTRVTDLAPLAELPLETLNLSQGTAYANVGAVGKIATLKTIDGAPAAAWLKRHEALCAQKREARVLPMPLKSAASAAPGDWPARGGPQGTGVAASDSDDWVDDMAHARRVWVSEATLPATQRGEDTDKSVPAAPVVGGFASPVVADGRVYVAFYVPNGPVYAEDLLSRNPELGAGRWRTDADDVLLCVDAATGRTLWRRAFVEEGYNFNARPEKSNCDMTPCVSDGRVFFLGTRGRVHCVDAKSGAPLWSSGIGYRAWDFDYFAWMSRKIGRLLKANDEFTSPVAVVGNVVATIDFRCHFLRTGNLGPSGLIGFDARTGVPLWEAPAVGGQGGMPLGWIRPGVSPGEECLVIGDGEKIHCVRGDTGKVAWSVPGGTTRSTVVTPDRLIAGMPKYWAMVSYAVGPDKAEALKWEGDALATSGVTEGSRPAATPSGTMYMNYSWKEPGPKKEGAPTEIARTGLAVVDIKNGKLVKNVLSPVSASAFLCAGNKVLLVCGTAATVWKPDGNKAPLRPFGIAMAQDTLPALAGGRVYLRTADRIACLELRTKFTELDEKEVKECLSLLKTDSVPRAQEAGMALRNSAQAYVGPALADLREYVKVDAAEAALGGGGKKTVKAKDLARVVAAADAMAGLATHSGVAQTDRDSTAKTLGTLLDVGTVDERKEICRIIGGMGTAGKAALPALRKAYAQVPLQEELVAAARLIMDSPNYVLTPLMGGDGGGTGEDTDLGL